MLLEIDPKRCEVFSARPGARFGGGDGEGRAVSVSDGDHRQERGGCHTLDEGARGLARKHEVQLTATTHLMQLSDKQLEQMIAHYDELLHQGRKQSPALIDGTTDEQDI